MEKEWTLNKVLLKLLVVNVISLQVVIASKIALNPSQVKTGNDFFDFIGDKKRRSSFMTKARIQAFRIANNINKG